MIERSRIFHSRFSWHAKPFTPAQAFPLREYSKILGLTPILSLAGHSSTMFLKPGELAMARRCIRRYGRLKELTAQLVVAYVAQARREGIASLTEGN